MVSLPLTVPASLATEPIGTVFAGSLQPGVPVALRDIAGFVLVRLMGTAGNRWFSAEATYNGPTTYGHAVWDLHLARSADKSTYRRVLTVATDGTYS